MVDKFNTWFRENVLYAGSSAVMLVYAHKHPELWFIAFFALIPFLSQLCRVSRREAPATGMILATIYVLATCSSEILLAPKVFLFKFLVLNIVFGFLSLTITRIRSRLRFDPILIAILTVPLSLLLIRWVDLRSVFAVMPPSPHHLAISFYSLFSVLLWATVIILGNSLILAIARYAISKTRPRIRVRKATHWPYFDSSRLFARDRHWYCLPDLRAPPTHSLSIAPRIPGY